MIGSGGGCARFIDVFFRDSKTIIVTETNPKEMPEEQRTRMPEEQRISLPGYGRDWRAYAGACAVAGALTLSVRFFTRRTHLPLAVAEPAMVYSRRMASRAFMYATCINIFAGIGIVAASAHYCEIDNVRFQNYRFLIGAVSGCETPCTPCILS